MEVIKQGFLNYSNKKVFIVFCINNNDSPFIEGKIITKKSIMRHLSLFLFYLKQTVYAKKDLHPPLERIELKQSKHVGVKIRRHIQSEQSFDFVIILENEILSFGCKRWDLMNDWVNCLKSKLRELKILSPKENFYSRPPVMRPLLQKTRNPRDDPLPECPINSSLLAERVPGLEVQQQQFRSLSNEGASITDVEVITEESGGEAVEEYTEQSYSQNSVNNNTSAINNTSEESQIESLLVETCTISENNVFDEHGDDSVTIPIFNFATSNTSSQNLINLLSNPLLRHRNAAQNIDFTSNSLSRNDEEFLDIENSEEEENIQIIEIKKETDNIPPTSLNIEYIPDPENHEMPSENVTIISTEAFSPSNGNQIIDKSKVTKIKIEMNYDYLYKATSSLTPEKASNNSINNIRESNKFPTSSIPTTSHSQLNSESKFAKSEPCTPRKQPLLPLATTTPQATPTHEQKRKSLREQQVFQLRQEINNEIRFKLRKKDCIDAIAFVSFKDSLWIAGFKANPQLYVFHVGDQLMAINNIANIKSNADAQKYIKMCGGLFVEITIRRLPLAQIFVIKRDFENQCLGLIRDGNSVLEIIPNSKASQSGIPARPSINNDDSIFWIITEINFRPLSLISHKKYDETDLLLNAVGLETSLLLQPSDFVAKIKKDLKAMKNYRDYTLQ